MRTWAKNTGRAALLAAGFVAIGAGFGSGIAGADTTNGDGSILGGNQIEAPISVPVNATGNGVAVVGAAKGQGKGGAHVTNIKKGHGGKKKTSGRGSIAGGNQIEAPVSVPVNACGNGVAVVGAAKGQCKGSATVTNRKEGKHGSSGHGSGHKPGGHKPGGHKPGGHKSHKGHKSGGWQTSGDGSILGGNQIKLPVSVPVNLCGNGIGIIGVAQGECKGSATVVNKSGEQIKKHYHHKLPSTLRKATGGSPVPTQDAPDTDATRAVEDLARSLGIPLQLMPAKPAAQSAPNAAQARPDAAPNGPADKASASTEPTRSVKNLVDSTGLPRTPDQGASGQNAPGQNLAGQNPLGQGAKVGKGLPVSVAGLPNNR